MAKKEIKKEEEVKVVKKAAPKKKVAVKKAPEKVEVKVEQPKELHYRGVRVLHVTDLTLQGRAIKQIQLENGNISRLPLDEFKRDVK